MKLKFYEIAKVNKKRVRLRGLRELKRNQNELQKKRIVQKFAALLCCFLPLLLRTVTGF